MEQSPRLSLSYVAPSQAQKHVTVNETFRLLDTLVQMTVRSRTETAEPATPAEGDAYIIPVGASGDAWDAYDAGDVAAYQDGAWALIPAQEGLCAWVADDDEFVIYDGAAWGVLSGGGGGSETAAKFGINTTADATNKLAVKSDAVLFNHDDVTPGSGDCQVKINKDAAGDTASLLFQTGASGRAEFGLTGDDKFHVKVSADGSVWTEAMVVASDGKVGVGTAAPAGNLEVHLNGAATDAALISNDNILLTGEQVAQSFAGIVASSTSTGHRMVFKGARAGGTFGSLAAAASGDFTFSLLGSLYDGAAIRATAGIEMIADGAVSSGVAPQRVAFYTGATTTRTERMRVASDGKVGIGETSPGSLLHVDGGGVQVGNPTGGDKGTGAINAQAVYDDNTLLSCYVFDQALDGAVDAAKWDAKTPDRAIPADIEYRVDDETGDPVAVEKAPARVETRLHEPMRKFAARAGTEYDPLTLDGYAKHWKDKRHLTAMPNEAAFDPVNGQLTAGEWIQRLVETAEIQAVLIEALNDKVKALEERPGRP